MLLLFSKKEVKMKIEFVNNIAAKPLLSPAKFNKPKQRIIR
jgi:hypothetical protein